MTTHDIAHPAYLAIEAKETPKEYYLRKQLEQREEHDDMMEMEQAFRRAYQRSLFKKRRI